MKSVLMPPREINKDHSSDSKHGNVGVTIGAHGRIKASGCPSEHLPKHEWEQVGNHGVHWTGNNDTNIHVVPYNIKIKGDFTSRPHDFLRLHHYVSISISISISIDIDIYRYRYRYIDIDIDIDTFF